jgi:hypothetical protein
MRAAPRRSASIAAPRHPLSLSKGTWPPGYSRKIHASFKFNFQRTIIQLTSTMQKEEEPKGQNVKVVLRCRPMTSTEAAREKQSLRCTRLVPSHPTGLRATRQSFCQCRS